MIPPRLFVLAVVLASTSSSFCLDAAAAPPKAAWCLKRWHAAKKPTRAQSRACAELFLRRAYGCSEAELEEGTEHDPPVPLGMVLRYGRAPLGRMRTHLGRLCRTKACEMKDDRVLSRAAELMDRAAGELWGLYDNIGGGGVGPALEPVLKQIFAGERLESIPTFSLIALIKLRNAPYARHGRPFRSKDLHDFFYGARKGSKVLPRKVDKTYEDSRLTAVDRANIAFLRRRERAARKQAKRW